MWLKFWLVAISLCGTLLVHGADPEIEEEEIRAMSYVKFLDKKLGELHNRRTVVEWNYEANITKENLNKKLAVAEEVMKIIQADWKETIKFNWKGYRDADLRRKFKMYSMLEDLALPEDKYKKLLKITSEMGRVYSTAKLCEFNNSKKCDLQLEPELVTILKESSNPEQLKHVWVGWRRAVGSNLKQLFMEYVKIKNEAAALNGEANAADIWLTNYDTPDIKEQISKLWEQVKPFYLQLHAYVRFKLRQKYGDEIVSEKGPIPAHLLGNMWAQTWENTYSFVEPYPGRNSSGIDEELVKQGYTPLKIFKTSEDFFTSLNLLPMPPKFWENSIFEKPKDGRNMVCHASAWDFYDGEDFRIKQCTRISEGSFFTAHHEMGHVQYYLQYKDQPVIYRAGANDGFHEAIGDTITLSVGTVKHLNKIGLLKRAESEKEDVLNNLMRTGLSKIVFLPFAYIVDLWRWNVFSGQIKPEEYNCKWWKLRNDVQGIEPPVNRSEEDFDIVSKYHVAADIPYLRYFISFILQFQFHRSLCEIAGEYVPGDPNKPLHECDIYGNKDAGEKLGKMLQMGSSKSWPDAMQALTGQRNMDASGILDYFDPLMKWLVAENKKNGAYIGWDQPTKVCTTKPH